MVVTQEHLAKTFLNLVAEIGGYLGLTLGVSLMDVGRLVNLFPAFKRKP